jgi:hypothetical protein
VASTVILMRIHLVKNIRHINRALLENMQNLMYSENMSEQQMSENFLRSNPVEQQISAFSQEGS